MKADFNCWVINHHCDEYRVLAFDDVGQELYVQIDQALFVVSYLDVAAVESFDAPSFRRRVQAQGKLVQSRPPNHSAHRLSA